MSNPSRGTTPQEAENAALVMSRLLRKYNLDIAMLDSEERKGNITHNVVNQDTIDTWNKELAYHLCKNNSCQVLVYDNPDPERITASGFFVFAGQPHNIAVVIELYDWLSQELPRMAYDAWVEMKKQPFPELQTEDTSNGNFQDYLVAYIKASKARDDWEMAFSDPAEWRRSYIRGVIWGWGEKLEREQRTASTEDGDTSALVKVMDQEVLDYIRDEFVSETVTVRSKSLAHGAYLAGKEAGEKLSTEKQVHGHQSVPELGANND